MRLLPRLALVASLAACTGKTVTPASLVIAMYTGDLDLPEDTDLVGLYIAQIEEGGRTRRVLAYEATPLREPGKPARIPFPSDFVVVSRGEADQVHVRLVAYKKQTHDVLTMREARTKVPMEDQRGLRLNLFFTNQNNVQDATPGAEVMAAAGSLSTRDANAEISSQAFERFTSLCDGAPAPAGMTAGDDGSCVPLEVPLESLPRTDAPEFLAGTREGDSCYDVHAAFVSGAGLGSGIDVARVATSTLPVNGECRIPLPAVFDPARLNVALVTNAPVFERPDGSYSGFRPLAAGLAFRQQGNEVVLPAHVCALARVPEVVELAFSQRALAWGGLEPVCSKWSTAAAARASDGAAPDPLPDAGPDASPAPTSVSGDIESAQGTLMGIAARGADLGVLTSAAPSLFEVALFAVPFVGGPPAQNRAFVSVSSTVGPQPTLVAVSNGSRPEPSGTAFYLQGSGAAPSVFAVDPVSFAQTPMFADSSLGGIPTHVAELRGRSVGLWSLGSDGTYAAAIESGAPTRFVAESAIVGFGIEGLAPEIGPAGPERFVIADSFGGTVYLDCETDADAGSCSKKELLPQEDTSILTYAGSARAGTGYFGYYRSGSQTPRILSYVDGTVVGSGPAPQGRTASLDDSFCGVYGSTDRKHVECFTAGMLRTGVGTLLLEGQVRAAAVASDGQGLNVAYQCADGGNVIHVTRVFSGQLHMPGVVVNRCVGTPDP